MLHGNCSFMIVAIMLSVGCSDETPAPSSAKKTPANSNVLLEGANPDLVMPRRGRAYVHAPSQTRFRLPQGWEVSPPQMKDRVSALQLQKDGDELSVTLTWSPMESQLVEVVADELKLFRQRYGDNNVGLLERVNSGAKTGWKVELASEVDSDVSRRGRVYWFEADAANGRRWKVKLRASFSRNANVAEIDKLLTHFEWTEREYGPQRR